MSIGRKYEHELAELIGILTNECERGDEKDVAKYLTMEGPDAYLAMAVLRRLRCGGDRGTSTAEKLEHQLFLAVMTEHKDAS